MNKNQRRNKTFRSDVLTRSKLAHELCAVSKNRSPTGIRGTKNVEKSMVNRCCLVHPKQKDFGHITKICDVEPIIVSHNDRVSSTFLACVAAAASLDTIACL